MTAILIDAVVVDNEISFRPEYKEADPDKRAHIFRGEENPELWQDGFTDAQQLVNLARDLQLEITAICGHKLVPSRDPQKHDICQPCIDTWNGLA